MERYTAHFFLFSTIFIDVIKIAMVASISSLDFSMRFVYVVLNMVQACAMLQY
jgi:hypothetical protein